MKNLDAIVYLEGQWNCMCSEDCQIYTGHKDCPQGFICNDGQALQMAISALQAQELQPTCNNLATDTISRQAAIDALRERPMVWTDNDQYALGERNQYDMDRLAIETVPAAEPEIIRCKDCKYWREGTVYSYCDKLYGMGVLNTYDYMTAEDDFCSRAERREE